MKSHLAILFFAAASAVATPVVAGGGFLDLSLSAGGGYDSNVFMDYEASAAPGVLASPFVLTAPGAGLRVVSGDLVLTAPIDATFKQFTDGASGYALAWHSRPGVAFVIGRLTLGASYMLDSYVLSAFNADDNISHAAAAVVRFRPVPALVVSAGYEGGLRSFSERWLDGIGAYQENAEHRARLRVSVRPAAILDVHAGYGFGYVDSNSDEFDETAHEATLGAAVGIGAGLVASPFLRAAFKRFDRSGRDDRLLTAGADLTYTFSSWLVFSLSYAHSQNLSSEQGMGYARDLAMLTVEMEYPVRLWTEQIEPAGPSPAPAPFAPVAHGRSVTFLHVAKGAKAVSVTGTFCGWARPGVSLEKSGDDGLWGVTMTLPSGATEYLFLVDGVLTRPADAPALVDDGYGGYNGLIVVE